MFPCLTTKSSEQAAEAACKSVYQDCTKGSCGSFSYYYSSTAKHCDCNTAVGQYQFIYLNSGYTKVGEDYHSGASTSLSENSSFVRRKASSGCNSNSWNLALLNLGIGNTRNIENEKFNRMFMR